MNAWNYSVRRYKRRLRTISLNALSQLVFPALSIGASWAVFHFSSGRLWGEFFNFLLFVSIAPLVISWGNEDYLLRAFSRKPASAPGQWQSSLNSRLLLLIPMGAVILFFPWTFQQKILVFIFSAARVIYQSYDVIILYTRKFLLRLLTEALGFAGIFLFIIIRAPELDVNKLLLVYTLTEVAKALFLLFFWRKDFPIAGTPVHYLEYLVPAFPFFILEFSGFLQSKVDLLCINYLMPPITIAHFQVLVNMLLYIQACSAFILQPFIKNIYRMDERQIRLMALRLFLAGIPIVASGTVFIYFVIIFFYHFQPPVLSLLLGASAMLPIFYYLPFIYALFGRNEQNKIIGLNLSGALLSFILNMLLIPASHDGQNGALLATAIVQWLLVIAYIFIYRNRPVALQIKNAA